MQTRYQKRPVRARESSAMEPGGTAVARGRRRTGALAITAAVLSVTLLSVTIVVLLPGGSTIRSTTHPSVAAPVSGPNAEGFRSTGVQEAVGWVDGLADDLILPSDVTSRLAVQDPRMARLVMAAWSDLTSLASSTRFQRALSWVDGLADDLILPSDVTSRLAVQDPRIARVVMAAWSDLNPVGVR